VTFVFSIIAVYNFSFSEQELTQPNQIESIHFVVFHFICVAMRCDVMRQKYSANFNVQSCDDDDGIEGISILVKGSSLSFDTILVRMKELPTIITITITATTAIIIIV